MYYNGVSLELAAEKFLDMNVGIRTVLCTCFPEKELSTGTTYAFFLSSSSRSLTWPII